MSLTRVELRGVSAGYEGRPVLHDVSLSVEPGRILALLGPSGCGKTTALRVVAGLLAPTQGEVLFNDADVTGVPAERRNVAMVFQKPLLFPYLNVGRNVAFGLRMRGVAESEMRRRVHEALQAVRLPGFEERRATELSGGQEQRVALARGLVTEPRVLLLDEPFAALDEELRAQMGSLVRDLQRSLEMTTVFVTHDQQEAAEMADAVALLIDGAVAQVGTVRTFFERPASAAVARFFGWKLWAQREGTAYYYRPEAARIAEADDAGEPGIVRKAVDLGRYLAVTVELDSGNVILAELNAAAGIVTAGRRVRVSVPDALLVAFPSL